MSEHDSATGLEEAVVTRAQRAVEARRLARRARFGCAGRAAEVAATRVLAHWLAFVTAGNALLLLGTVVAPWLRAHGHRGLAAIVYGFYRLQCLQRPSHSFFLFGEQMGMEQRMVAIYGGWLVAGLVFGRYRKRLRTLPGLAFVLASAPMGLDIGSQMVGLRGSTWPWRVGTGVLFALASAWWALPRIEVAMRAVVAQSRQRIADRGGNDRA